MARKNEIKEQVKDQIAHLLMRSNVGLIENAIIQQITATSNVKAITEALAAMKNVSEIVLDGKRWKITPIGRSIYSELNNSDLNDSDLNDSDLNDSDLNDSDLPEKTYPLSILEEEYDLPAGIEVIPSFKTPDGKIHETSEAAVQHMNEQRQLTQINQFIESIGSPGKQRNIVIGYITRWEKFKRENAA